MTSTLHRLLAACLPFALLWPGTSLAQAQAELPTPEKIMALRVVGDPQIDREGAWIAYTVGTPQGQGKPPRSRIWRVAASGKTQARELPAPDTASEEHPRWTADGRYLDFVSDRPLPGDAPQPGVAATQVWRIAAQGDAPTQITRSQGDVSAFDVSRDGTRIAYLAMDPTDAAAQQATDRKDDAVRVEHPTRFSRAWVRELPNGEAHALTAPGLQVHDLAWSPDGRTLALRVSDGTTLNDYWYRSRVVLVDAASGALGQVLESRASAHPLQWSPDGTRLLFGRLGDHGMTADLTVQDIASGHRTVLANDWNGTLWLARWQDDHTLVGEGQRGARGAFLRLDARDGRWREIARPQIPFQSFTTARSGRSAYLGIRDDQPAEVWTLDNGKLAGRTDHHPEVAGWAHGQVRELEWKSSRDGLRITGLLVTPPGWKRGTPLPTLVQGHGGPAWAWWSGWLGSWHDWAQLLSTHGYAVFLPNPRGSEGGGHAFAEMARNDWGGADFQDILDGVDVLEKEGVIDPQRLAIGGWSYGGYMSAWAVTHSDRFKTAIVGAGVIDIGAMALTTDTQDYLPGYFGDPVTNRAAYDAHSPIRYADQVKVPVLILHGEQDKRVPLSQGEMFYRALKFNGTPVEMVTYPRGPHWFYEREHGRDVQQRVLDWLDAQLGVTRAE
ncbi:peptidase S9, prolyl oligopeptidase activesite domain protein [Stenotrophomonas panacihumi]|uniref:Peptidase S9, prolyl oligopeptidase activesite domain protein n=1 Tax=Stenotrophomonas panacihumi TaxID=676599 RepID=A0A0R0AP58_9GAMM|nr:S9 family peptidase [Stenotrophomonas panacihumi]KRG44210.1 peptidase S9, prolyl oligopeptidase activesite domain protein [Stenotrophomonas panacihumi]PTN56227.1 S9 family peptidase [Stenotrophomonas panacihumi]